MFSILSCLGATHDARFVAASVAICVVGALCTVVMLSHAEECGRDRRRFWIVAASAVAGTGVWATHFMAMLAYDGGYPVAYDGTITVLSILVSVLSACGSFFMAFRWTNAWAVAASGVAFGLGVALMHFVGMSALDSPGHLSYSASLIALAVAVSAALGGLSLLAMRRTVGWMRIVTGTALTSLTVCTLHFTSMAGLTLVPDPTIVSQRLLLIDRAALAAVVASVSGAIVLFGCLAAIMDRLLTDVRGLADASLEALFITHQDRVLEVNESAAALTGLDRGDILGRHIREIVVRSAEHLKEAGRALGVIGVLSPLTGRQTEVEIFVREIEYRGRPCCVVVLRDLTERRRAERVIDHMARHDPLTDLLNRREFDRHLKALTLGGDRSVSLLCLDLDNFKLVNDMGGHAAGDEILRNVAAILQAATVESDLVFRLGGDEFAIIQIGQIQPQSARDLAEKILNDIASMSASFGLNYFGASVGIALLPGGIMEAETLHSRADAALYSAKDAGRGQIRFFETHIHMPGKLRKPRSIDADPIWQSLD